MRVLVWGLGHIGTVNAAGFAELGHEVVGVDLRTDVAELLGGGVTALHEPGLGDLVSRHVARGRLRVATIAAVDLAAFDVTLVCVPIPAAQAAGIAFEALHCAAATIGRKLRDAAADHVVALRSTAPPGTTRGLLRTVLESESGRAAGDGFGLAAHPEFLREGSSVADFLAPPHIVIGALDPSSGRRVAALYSALSTPVAQVEPEEAELLKLASNAFHAVKVGFANEIGRLGAALRIDPNVVMRLLRADVKLNASPAYLVPGFAFGGSCLPKDLRMLVDAAGRAAVDLPLLGSVLASNAAHVDDVLRRVLALGARRVGIVGLAFKPGTNDLRESPALDLVRALADAGLAFSIFDPDVVFDALPPAGREALESVPGGERALRQDFGALLREIDGIVFLHDRPELVAEARRAGLDGRILVIGRAVAQ